MPISRKVKNGSLVLHTRHRTKPASRRQSSRSSGVMIVPPPPGSRSQIQAEMTALRQQLRDSLGPEAYDERIRESNELFKKNNRPRSSLIAGFCFAVNRYQVGFFRAANAASFFLSKFTLGGYGRCLYQLYSMIH